MTKRKIDLPPILPPPEKEDKKLNFFKAVGKFFAVGFATGKWEAKFTIKF